MILQFTVDTFQAFFTPTSYSSWQHVLLKKVLHVTMLWCVLWLKKFSFETWSETHVPHKYSMEKPNVERDCLLPFHQQSSPKSRTIISLCLNLLPILEQFIAYCCSICQNNIKGHRWRFVSLAKALSSHFFVPQTAFEPFVSRRKV